MSTDPCCDAFLDSSQIEALLREPLVRWPEASPVAVREIVESTHGVGAAILAVCVDAASLVRRDLTEQVVGAAAEAVARTYPAWLPEAEHLAGPGGAGLAAVRAICERVACNTDLFGPFLIAAAEASLCGRPIGVVEFAQETAVRQARKLILRAYGYGRLVVLIELMGKLAADIAQTLLAETVNDPMLGGTGEAVDPSALLQPASGRGARISVISLVGLPNDEQRQQFVNQLQMALFAWVKRHPAGDRPLGGLFVMDEAQTFAPSAGRTATTDSTLALASQARKYGLGLVFATQAPNGLHNRIPGNATTQFFGLLNAPVQIAAAREMAVQKGGDARSIARLRPGEFFAASDAVAFQRVRTPMCLSHHPRSPMTQEEVLELARARTADPE